MRISTQTRTDRTKEHSAQGDSVRAAVDADAEEAKSLGITGTPTLIIGDWMESGIPTPEDLYARIDEALGN
jgi:protein-disulfide isomerase